MRSIIAASVLAWASIAHAFVPTTSFGMAPVKSATALNVAIDTSDIKNGLTVEIDGEPYKVLNFSIMKQARGAAKTTIKFKNLMRGNTIENTYRSGEKFQTAQIDKSNHVFTYEDGNSFFFMDSQTFDEVPVDANVVESADLIAEGMEVMLVFFKDKVIECVLPKNAIYTVTETGPNAGAGKDKPAVLSSGATISVPGYVEVGETIRIDTEKREFLGRAS
eukprot:CAMPEP_0198113732 /NCGR_PEP_ID=MMETSP1442-20131203/5330_1 /TAXON_ID= /ORGANISM="Craspedostauros australis, Strain CCMP3328" /LENGTH=219 /DNA_ID=CAMNT_0043770903 /DNA_START=142 /DNA_END=801 /DNA_ORIENTATION=+